MKRLVDEKWAQDKANYETTKAEALTPARYQNALEKGAVYLQRVADTVATHMGMVCSIILCGPIAEREGCIECRGIHSGQTFASGVKWNDFDPAGYQKVEEIMVRFGTKCFTEAEIASCVMGLPTDTESTGEELDEESTNNEDTANSADAPATTPAPAAAPSAAAPSAAAPSAAAPAPASAVTPTTIC
ncbi:hypothetical protein CPB85DRAFT_1439993 [Mucidula mucida]|nr:hypothetical protein CPB85DRAFT_1439993 [Mucidula mucida]